jgi:hypothetical protein
MKSSVQVVRVALIAAGVMSVLAAAPAAAQRRAPRVGVAASPPPENATGRAGYPAGSHAEGDPRWPGDPRWRTNEWSGNRRGPQNPRGSTIVYVPVPIGGYGYSYDGYYAPRAGQVYDATGRPLSASYEQAPASIGYGYTPDLTGSPYAISDEGMMVVDFPSGERRAFPSCAGQSDLRDPQGRPRTIFYQPTDYWMILKPGQRGRVHGEPAANAKACYAIDSAGRVVLRE